VERVFAASQPELAVFLDSRLRCTVSAEAESRIWDWVVLDKRLLGQNEIPTSDGIPFLSGRYLL
jgi:hypothetical protein